MNFVVTGGAGFIGSHLVDRLLGEGHSCICLDNFDDFYDPSIKRNNISEAESSTRFTLIEGDVRDEDALARCFSHAPADVVVHLAARAGVRPSLFQPQLYFDVNVTGTLCLLEAMQTNGLSKLILGSSSSVYGNNPKTPFSEQDPVDHPISPYAASKKASELLCHTFHHLYGFDIFCLRFFTVYGPRQRPEMAISQFARKIMDGEKISVFGDGSSRRDYTYVDDIVHGIMASIERVEGFEVLNLGESRTVTLSFLISTLEKVIGRQAVIERQPIQPGDVTTTYADITKAKDLIDYNPRWQIERGVEEFVAWLKTSSRKNPIPS